MKISGAIPLSIIAAALALAGSTTAFGQGRVVTWSSLIAPDKLTKVADVIGTEDFWTGHYGIALGKDGTLVAWGSSANPAKTKLPAGLSGVVSVAGGRNFCLALKGDGSAVGWGGGDGLPASQIPQNLTQVKAIAAGGYHALALKQDGTVAAWGNNSSGQCNVPPGLNGVVAVAAGLNSSAAVKSDGSVVCWGSLIDGSPATAPSGLAGVSALAAGDGNFLAVKNDGTGAGWGTNWPGQSPTIPFPLFPSWDKGLDSADIKRLKRSRLAGVSGGINESVAWLSNGRVIPANAYHPIAPRPAAKMQILGPQFYTLDRRARLHAGGPNAKQLLLNGRTGAKLISAGHWYSAAVFKNDLVRVSGERRFLQDRPKRASGRIRGIKKIVSGQNFDVVLFENGNVATEGHSDEQKAPSGLSGVTDVDAGGGHAIALKEDGTVVTWGNTEHIQSRLAVPEALRNAATARVKAIAATDTFCIALQEGGKLFVWGGASWEGPLDALPASLPEDVDTLAGGWRHFLARRANGTVLAYGDNGAGQASVPAGLSGVKSIAAAGRNSMALKEDGTVVVWGAESTIPSGLANVTAISAGPYHCMAIVGDAGSKRGK